MTDMNPSNLVDKKIEALDDWRGVVFKRLRKLIHEAEPQKSKSDRFY